MLLLYALEYGEGSESRHQIGEKVFEGIAAVLLERPLDAALILLGVTTGIGTSLITVGSGIVLIDLVLRFAKKRLRTQPTRPTMR
ncbi:MAG: hypothetical protein AAGI52_17955 [Bacteroidota bacterium]